MSDKEKKAALSEEKATKKEKKGECRRLRKIQKRKRKKVRFQENCRLV